MKVLIFLLINFFLFGCGKITMHSNIIDESNSSSSTILDENHSIGFYLEDNFVKRDKINYDIQTIWNLPLKIYDNSHDINRTINIGIQIVKESTNAIGSILIEGVTIRNNNIVNINSLTIFGKKSSGSTGSIKYLSNNITFNSISINNGLIYLNLGYIMENQRVISNKNFKKKSYYNIDIYISNFNLNTKFLDEPYKLEISYNNFYTFYENTQYLSGLIIID